MVLELVNSNNTGPVLFLTQLTFIVYTKTAKTFFKIFCVLQKKVSRFSSLTGQYFKLP